MFYDRLDQNYLYIKSVLATYLLTNQRAGRTHRLEWRTIPELSSVPLILICCHSDMCWGMFER